MFSMAGSCSGAAPFPPGSFRNHPSVPACLRGTLPSAGSPAAGTLRIPGSRNPGNRRTRIRPGRSNLPGCSSPRNRRSPGYRNRGNRSPAAGTCRTRPCLGRPSCCSAACSPSRRPSARRSREPASDTA